MKRRPALLLVPAAVVTPAPVASAAPPEFNLDSADIPALRARMASGRLTAVELTRLYLDRVHRIDGKVNAVLAVDPPAPGQALESDARRHAHRLRGPLDSIPVLVKDNVDTRDRRTTAGSRAPRLPDRGTSPS